MAEVRGEEDGPRLVMPTPETEDLGRYLEDTITIDWQTPAIMERARSLLSGLEVQEERLRVLFEFVRDEIEHSIDHSVDPAAEKATCRASEVLGQGTGLCYAKSHLLAALLRFAGFPSGFCYVRLASESDPARFSLHGFNAVYRGATGDWLYLDARGNKPGLETECRFEAPWSLAYAPDPEAGEAFLPFIYKRPAKRIIDLLERAPDFAAVLRNLPDSL